MKLQEYINKHGNVEIEEKQLNELLGIKESKVWKPKDGEIFYYINCDGKICRETWRDSSTFSLSLYKLGNCFKTIEEAKFALERLIVTAELQRYADEHNEWDVDWKNSEQAKYDIYYDIENNIIDYCSYYGMKFNAIYFTSEEIARQAVESVGTERVKKYYLGVE